MLRVDLDLRPTLESECRGTFVRTEAQKRLGIADLASTCRASSRRLQLAELFQRVDSDIRVRAGADRDPTLTQALDGCKAVSEVGLGCGGEADAGARGGQQVELVVVGVRGMDDRRSRPEAAGPVEQLERTDAVVGKALLDLAGLLVRVDVEREAFGAGITPDLLEPVGWAGADGVESTADTESVSLELFELGQILRGRALAEARAAITGVGREEKRDLDVGVRGGLDGGARLGEPEVVELSDGRVPSRPHLAIRSRVLSTDGLGCVSLGLRDHRLAPGPEVTARPAATQRALECVAVRIDEPGQGQTLAHREGSSHVRLRDVTHARVAQRYGHSGEEAGRTCSVAFCDQSDELSLPHGRARRPRPPRPAPECADDRALRRDPDLHRARGARGRR